ncbi:MAG TPA: phosphoribosylglycinamide formyltransferase [Nitrososphaeraceae archaeon]
MLNLAILISGRGSNMEAILKSIDEGQIRNVRPKIVVSNRSDSPGLKLAVQKFGVSTYVLSKGKDKALSLEDELVQVLDEFGVHPKTGVICLAGFMRILSPRLVQRYTMRILNIHPSLLPAFPGLHAQRQALQYGAKVSGCTIHFVDRGVDTGPIIMQRAISIFDSDTEESLSQRILEIEHKLYPEALRLFSEGNLKIDGRRISITDSNAKNRSNVV